jgi:probable HAF family extracellular repeat protein
VATAINARGQIVGVSHLAGRTVRHAFLYENGAMTDLGSSLPPGTSSFAFDVNASGRVAGSANLPVVGQTPVFFENGLVVELIEKTGIEVVEVSRRYGCLGFVERAAQGDKLRVFLGLTALKKTETGPEHFARVLVSAGSHQLLDELGLLLRQHDIARWHDGSSTEFRRHLAYPLLAYYANDVVTVGTRIAPECGCRPAANRAG